MANFTKLRRPRNLHAMFEDTRRPSGIDILFAGFNAVEIQILRRLYAKSDTELTFIEGSLSDLHGLTTKKYQAVAVQIEQCVLFAPQIIKTLRLNDFVEHGGDIIAVSEHSIANLNAQLVQSGATANIKIRGDYGLIFPERLCTEHTYPF